ncbi:MAG: Flp pilus assembly protein TadG [Cognaticolwellia sp.]|jgi:Flp pilus assembly protein TadG
MGTQRTRRRGGNYAILLAFAIVVVLGFGAIAVDTSYMRLAKSQAQDVADAASQAALIVLRRTGSTVEAENAAREVLAQNVVVGSPPALEDITFGTWDPDTSTLTADEVRPNAVQVTVARTGDDSPGLFMAPVFGYPSFNVRGQAVSAARSLHVVVVMDITNSWNPNNFNYAREAAVALYDTLSSTYDDTDMIGMTVFTGRYAWEFTPMTYMADAELGTVRSDWENMNTGSKAGDSDAYPWPAKCNPYKSGPLKNNFDDTDGGCYSQMPREYLDEPGTDHTAGLAQAAEMFSEQLDTAAFRAMIVITDGYPSGTKSGHGDTRDDAGYVEDRWREYQAVVPHSTSQIESESVDLTAEMWEDQRVHTWVVSFVNDSAFMELMPRGQGYYTVTDDPQVLVPILEDIANSLPLAIVE